MTESLTEFGVEADHDDDRDAVDNCSCCGTSLVYADGASRDQCVAVNKSGGYRCPNDCIDGEALCGTHLRAWRRNGDVSTVDGFERTDLPGRGQCPNDECGA